MNLFEFIEIYKSYLRFDIIEIQCENPTCGEIVKLQKNSARLSIKRNGNFWCSSCVIKKSRLGQKHSEESKKSMSEWRINFYKTPEGIKQKKKLSKLAAKQHSSTNMDKSKRKVLYISDKNNGAIRVCNSSGEFVACEDFLEKDPNVVKYETQVYYEINDRCRSLDFLVYYKDSSVKVIEVKPAKRLTEVENFMQLQDSRLYAEDNNWEFEVWTEKELRIDNWKTATSRADEYRKTHYEIDYAAYRIELDKGKAKRHYDNKIANDKVVVWCEFCNDYHERLKITYEKNVKKNGRFVCIKENGSLVGKKPYKKKENPYGPDKKKCNKCDRILPLDCFSKGKARCKECRTKFYREQYRSKE